MSKLGSPAGQTEQPARTCRICGGSNGFGFSANGFAWFQCKGCGSVQKVLTPVQYVQLSPTYDPGRYLDDSSRDHLERFLRIDDARKVLEVAVRRLLVSAPADGTKRSFLDVGCGMGAYLLAAQTLGFEVTGFEPSKDHAYVATEHLRLPVIPDYFSPDLVDGRMFDLVMLSHVIEHIYAPKKFIHDLLSVLKPGGVLIVITPNSDSVLARLTGSLWPMLKPVDHVSMVSARTYSFFELEDVADVHHHYSEYPYEFAATVAAVLKAKFRSRGREDAGAVTPLPSGGAPVLRQLNAKAQLVKSILTVLSVPAWLVAMATRKQACLTSLIVRREVHGIDKCVSQYSSR